MRAFAITVALVAVLAAAPAATGPAAPHERAPETARFANAAYEDPAQPVRQPRRLNPSQFAAANKPRLLAGSKRHQMVLRRGGRLDLMIGQRVDWTGSLAEAGVTPRAVTGFADIHRLVQKSPHPDWLTELQPGIFVLRAALVQAPRTRLVIATPRVKQLRMMTAAQKGQEVYLTGVSAKVAINGTEVTSWGRNDRPDPTPSMRRPFVSYDQPGTVLTVSGARFSYLGGDSILGYGVTWGRGARGSAIGSTFDHNFFGAYSNEAVGVLFLRNTFRDNDLYGLDPHSHSRRLRVVDNVAFGNGSHGIIFSEEVVDSVLSGNRSFGNRVNGIMMDKLSARNLIVGNQAWSNDGDGIVVQNSSSVTIRANVVSDNRVGVRVTGESLSTTVAANRLVGNDRGIEIYEGPATARALTSPTTVSSNDVIGNNVIGAAGGDGIAVKNFAGVRVAGNKVTRYLNGVLLAGRSARARVSSNRLSGQARGIEVGPQVVGARLHRNIVESASERGLVLAGPGTVSTDDTVSGSDIAVDVRNNVVVTGVRVRDGRRGINVFSGTATVSAADVSVHEHGVNVEAPGKLHLRRSTIVANRPIAGVKAAAAADNRLDEPPPPFRWLALAGVLFIVTAVCLHLVHRRRAPACHPRATAAPAGVRNAW